MNILALDAANGACSVSIYSDAEERVLLRNDEPSKQAEMLVPMIEQALAQASLNYEDMDVVATSIGPGSFTGVRIGLATARGIALAANLPLMGITTLDCMAYAMRDNVPEQLRVLAVVQDARREQFYFQCFDRSLAVLDEPILVDADELRYRVMEEGAGGVTVISNNWKIVAPVLKESGAVIVLKSNIEADAALVAKRALMRYKEQGLPAATDAHHVRPLYIRPPDAKMPQAMF